MKFVIYQDKKKEWRWRLVAANNLIVADSGEGYQQKEMLLKTLFSITENIKAGSYEIEGWKKEIV